MSQMSQNEIDLLPHFNSKFMLEMRAHLRKRILEESPIPKKVPVPGRDPRRRQLDPVIAFNSFDYAAADELAREMVGRIYRTQLREAKGIISFSDAMIEWNNRHNPAAQLHKPGQGDGGKAFDKVVNKVRRSFGAGALQEKY